MIHTRNKSQLKLQYVIEVKNVKRNYWYVLS